MKQDRTSGQKTASASITGKKAQKTGGQSQAHTVTATTPVQLTTLVSVNSIINYPDKTEFFDYVNNVIEQCREEIKHFKVGRIKQFIQNWSAITSDESILSIVRGEHLQFVTIPNQVFTLNNFKFTPTKNTAINEEIQRLQQTGVIKQCLRENGDFVSNVFVRPKKDGKYRMILNLKRVNSHMVYYHFKMDTLLSAVAMMRPNCFMASIDLKDAYYSVPIHPEDHKYLKFQWNSQYYQYTAFLNGLSSCPRQFTKLMKPVYSTLRKQSFESVAYLDDSFLMAATFSECVNNVKTSVTLLKSLGFVIHPDKSVLVPTQKLTF